MPTAVAPKPGSRSRLLDAAMAVIRAKGYSDTTVEDVCAAAGLTKGAFFHHFETKEDLAVAAAEHFAGMAAGLFASAPFHAHADPRDRVLGYIDFRASILKGPLPACTCLLGTMVQETYETHPAIREACHRFLSAHAAWLAGDIARAKRMYAPRAKWTPESLALFTQAVLQGAFIIAKAGNSADAAAGSVAHLRRYVESLLTPGPAGSRGIRRGSKEKRR